MRKIEIEIKEIENGWIVSNSYYGEEAFFGDFKEASPFAKNIITKYKREENL